MSASKAQNTGCDAPTCPAAAMPREPAVHEGNVYDAAVRPGAFRQSDTWVIAAVVRSLDALYEESSSAENQG